MKIGDCAPAFSHYEEKYNCPDCGLEAWYAPSYPDDPHDDLCSECYDNLEDSGTRYSWCPDCRICMVSEYIDESGKVVSAEEPLYCEECSEARAEYATNYITRMRASTRHGYVYLLDAKIGVWKIGRSSVPVSRVRKLDVVLPYELDVTALIETGDMYRLEGYLHTLFGDKRIKGEWFQLNREDVQLIKKMVPVPRWRRACDDLMMAEEWESWR